MDPNEDPDMEPAKKEKKKSRKSSSKSEGRKSSGRRKSSSKKKSSSSQEGDDYNSDEGQWDPVKFDEQTGDRWKDIDKPKRVADLPSPDIADYERQEGDDDWPYKKSYAVDERKSKSKKEKGLKAPNRTKSDDEGEEKRSSKKDRKSSSRKSKSSRSSSSRDKYDDEAAEVSDEEEDLHSEEEDEARARRRPKKSSSRRSESEQSSGDVDDDVSEGYDDGQISDSDEFSEDASFYSSDDEPYNSELDGSIDSDGSYDSAAEDYGEYGNMPPETPAMMNYNQEINDLMNKANPEHTDHLMNRVNRQKGNIQYDQNMPMMTRQALMTQRASAQAARNRVDANSIDRSKLGFRNESFHKNNAGSQKPVRRGPGGKRAPPRSKSSGLGTMAMAGRRAAPSAGADAADDPRSRFRGKGASTSFQRHSNKPNNVARVSGRRGGEMDRSGHRPGASRGEPRRGNVGRAKSTTALSRGAPDSAQKPLRRQPRRTTKEEQLKSNEVSDDSDVESSEEESDSDEGRPKRRVKKVVDKQDMTIKKHRRKLHGMMYTIKMSVDMSDLMKEVKKGEIPKSPIKSLLMDEP